MKKVLSAFVVVMFTMGLVFSAPCGDKAAKAKASKKGETCAVKKASAVKASADAQKAELPPCCKANKCNEKDAAKASMDVKQEQE